MLRLSRAGYLWLRLLAMTELCLCLAGFAAARELSDAAAGPEEMTVKIRVSYLGKDYEEPPPLSLLDRVLFDNGVAGARIAINNNNTTGSFLDQEFVLDEAIVPASGDVIAKAKEIFANGNALIVADLEPTDLLAVADLPEANGSVILNIRSSNDALRQVKCRSNVFHIVPSDAMRADALAQYLVWKRWTRWLLLKGTTPGDEDYAAAVRRAAARFGGHVVDERTYKFEAGNNRTDSGHQQIQTQMPELTQGAPSHDVVWVADTAEVFGEYVPYRTYDAKPVVGTQGLVAVAWHRSYEQYAGTQLQQAFENFVHRTATERDYSGWLAVRVFGEAATRSGKADVASLRDFILSDRFKVAGYKGQQLTFRSWDHQLRQPILIAGARALVSMSPQEGFLHEKFLTDTLGFDAPESKCRFSNNH
jgi:ABC transporter substrate binding protein (PQQ-dependent alcohol dehydrogenase system)